jgi:hypothetical protein
MSKTRDGLKLSKIISAVRTIPGLEIKSGSNHKYLLSYDGLRPCPVDTSTHIGHMVIPWMKKIESFYGVSKADLYTGMKTGRLY